MGLLLFTLSEFALAREHLESGMSLDDPQKHRAHIAQYGHDPGVLCLNYSACILWFMGYPDQTIDRQARPRPVKARSFGYLV